MPGASLQEQRNNLAVFRRSLLPLFYIDNLSLAQTKHFTPKAYGHDVSSVPGALRVGLARDYMEISWVLDPIYLPAQTLDSPPADD